jgi:uncharacterized protein (TIGR02246 family)
MRSILGIAVAAIIVAVSGLASAQQTQSTDPANSPFAAIGKQYVEAYNRKDAAAVAALFTDDAVRVNAQGIVRGREDIQKTTKDALDAGGHDLNLQYREAHIDGNNGWSIAEANFRVRGKDGADTPVRVLATTVWVQSGGVWKIRAQSLVNAPPPKQ